MPLIECIAFGSLISATDPVAVINIFKSLNANKMLFIIIFGESILNDAIAIIFYEYIKIYIYIYTRTTVEIYHQVDITFGQGVNTFIYMLGGSIIVGFLIGLICALVTIFQ
jgi:NhaP-type Na+/H+ or K+/H+ antiporter